MTTEKELRLSANELKKIVWICDKCKAEQSLDISSEEQGKTLDSTSVYFECGVCGSACDIVLFRALKSLKDFYIKANETRNKIFFRISISDEKEKTE
jgi:epoxyqueuosine reductase QueG